MLSRQITDFDDLRHVSITADEPRDGDGSVTNYLLSTLSGKQHPLRFMAFPGDLDGITHEALLAVIIDRLQNFQNGNFACDENDTALYYCLKALETLQSRAKDRASRGVFGKYEL